jgi:hypothetical protein
LAGDRGKKTPHRGVFSCSPTASTAARRLPETVMKNPVFVIGKKKDHPNAWSFFLLASVTDLDANLDT